jgi:acyl carrier protein
LKTILEILAGIRPEFDFSGSEDFIEDGMLDSFDVMTLVSDLEKNFAVTIDGLDILPKNVKNVAAIRALLAKYGVSA